MNQVADHSIFHLSDPKSRKPEIPVTVKGRTFLRERNQRAFRRKDLLVLIAKESVMMN